MLGVPEIENRALEPRLVALDLESGAHKRRVACIDRERVAPVIEFGEDLTALDLVVEVDE